MRQKLAVLGALLLSGCAGIPAADWPRTQLVPQPDDQISFRTDGREVLRYHYGGRAPKPYFYPVIGPAGAPLTRLTHPHDPFTHRHHLSLWIGHQNVNGQNFWEQGRIVHERIVKLEDGEQGRMRVRARWLDADQKPLLLDERLWTLIPGGPGEYALDLELTLTPASAPVTFGRSHFGLLALRVAKMMGTNDGGGTITSSERRINEAQLMPHRRAKWCDYSGRSTPSTVEGITLMDHPDNANHPTYFHVRGDGWMGSSFSEEADVVVTKEAPLRLKYRFHIHRGPADPDEIDAAWERWARPK